MRPAMTESHTITDLTALESLFGTPGEASLRKEVPTLHPVYRRWVEASPFAVLATAGPGGLDASPRGDPASLVTVIDEHTVVLPERRGNNRIDSLRNILADPRVAMLFLIPGIREALRINGRARITVDPDLLARLAMNGIAPTCAIEIAIDTVYFQCARALERAKLWGDVVPPDGVPSAGAILHALTDAQIDGVAYDRELPQRMRSTLY
jgi:PPOX class probable FMN-dependent enzyme